MKAEVDPLHVVVGAAILLMVFVVSVLIYTNFIGRETNIAKCQLENIAVDCDCDGKKNAVDPCPCDVNNAANCKKTSEACFDPKKCECKTKQECQG